jgi:hypothetical protein
MYGTIAVAVLVGGLAGGAALAEERRELGAHVHGHSTLAIAVEGSRIAMELHAPGMDILGFEHAPSTSEQKAALDRAKAALADPLDLFVLPQAAGCRTTEAAVELETEEHAHEEGAEHHEEAEHAEHAEDDEHGAESGHAEFEVTYALDCKDPAEIASIAFAFFDRFANAEEVEVTLLTERGQSVYEVTRAAPRIVLDGLM